VPVSTLADLRRAAGLSLRDVQRETAVKATHLSEIERGRKWPTPQELDVLSRFYNVSSEEWKLMLVQETKP
jgi:transcriptional regulator with XRE-family HTH domain